MNASRQRNEKERNVSGRSVRARYPDRWPMEMRADAVAALFDFETTAQLWKAITRGEAPRPTAHRLRKGCREPIWALEICHAFIARRHAIENNEYTDDIRSLL